MDSYAFQIVLCGALVAVNCSLLGSFLILRGQALVADAISHSVLPGIVAAFLFSGARAGGPLLVGAGAVGLLTTLGIEFLHRRAKVQSDAAIGITFTALFALGVVLVTALAGQVDLDQDCVLYGELAYVPLDPWLTANGWDLGPRAAWTSGFCLVVLLVVIGLFFKQLYLTSFDPAYAASLGLATGVWHYVLMGLTSLVTVASFEAVGAILVVALMVAPPATAFQLTRRFRAMLGLAAAVGVLTAVGGYVLAAALDASVAGAMAVVAGALFVAAWAWGKWRTALAGA
ncbi:MAG: metal ABC transporter permease [Bernardetiaceae bacterium]|jgi:manganese/zinc/iron transport system permease protein|nr:metal ABC transporter permease [Bernardetiaceae bacterium]